MKVLVTGVAGFIASNLTEHLLNEGHTIVGIDKERTPYLNLFIDHENFYFIHDDINNINNLSDMGIEELKDIKKVYHLAASADIRKSYQNLDLDLHNNIQGTHEILKFMAFNNITDLIFSSTSSVYGNSTVVPTPEDVPSIKPISLYGASKLSCEALISAFCNLYNMRAWIFRFANVVGKNQHRGVIYDFIQKLSGDETYLKILGNGKQQKSFFDVDDCIIAITHIPNNPDESLEAKTSNSTRVYNIGNIDVISIKELADVVCDELKLSPTYNMADTLEGWPGDTKQCILNINKALATGWRPQLTCEQSIRKTVNLLK